MTKPRICECCGQLIPPENPFEGQPVKARIYDFIAKRPGCSRDEIADHVYADDPSGGAFNATISVHVHWMNLKLAKVGLRIHSKSWHGYRIVPLGAKLSGGKTDPDLIAEIRDLYPKVRSHRKLAAQLGVSVGTVQRYLSEKT